MDFFTCAWPFFTYFDNSIEWETALLNDIAVRVNIPILTISDNVNTAKRFGSRTICRLSLMCTWSTSIRWVDMCVLIFSRLWPSGCSQRIRSTMVVSCLRLRILSATSHLALHWHYSFVEAFTYWFLASSWVSFPTI